jgi:hypothetical protein
MLTYNELLVEIKQLPLEKRLLLLETLSHSVREEIIKDTGLKGSPAEKVRGLAKPDGPMPSDEELKEDYVNYLLEKHA